MTDRTMRPALFLAALNAFAYALPSGDAQAQAINANATVYVDDDKLDNGSNVYINREQCNSQWRFELQNYATAVPYLEMWVTNNTSTNCADQANRSSPNNTNPVCWQVGSYQNLVRNKATFTANGGEIFNANERSDTSTCDEGIGGTKYKVQFVTLDSNTQPNTATVTASNNNPNQISAIFTLYSKVPDPPSNPKARSGGRTLGIGWERVGNDPLTKYRAYFDHDPDAVPMPASMNGGTDIDSGAIACGTGKLDGTRTVDDAGTSTTVPKTADLVSIDNMITFESDKTNGESVSISDLDAKGIAYDTYTAVSVFAIDGAGNRGTLSTPVCVKRVQTIGYLQACQDGGADCGELHSCSLSPRNTGSAFWLSACTLALSAWARRRRRST